MKATADVVVVGGGIAGSALATALARGGLDVYVLERQTVYRDKVRGETLQPWGVAELCRLGLDDALLGAGGGYCRRVVPYDETTEPEAAEANAFALDELLPDVKGSLNVGHPAACEALAFAAVAAGARMERGVGEVRVEPGPMPVVVYELDDVEREIACRLVIGADGRSSSIRRQIGCQLNATEPRTVAGGLLVEGLEGWPDGVESFGTEGNVMYTVFPRPGGRARLYLLWSVVDKNRFTGANRVAEFLDAFRLDCLPKGEEVAAARPAGPCASYPMNDTWIDRPLVDGVVLVGDAAGWSDPIIGQGLAISLRDARTVSEIMESSADWSPRAFAPYVEERSERMRRLRMSSHAITELYCTFTSEGTARRKCWQALAPHDELLIAPLYAALAGPEKPPAEAFAPRNQEAILALNG
jgi:2-polyprenyl-6-methoxyphenol hydroxylase-like FAD-dependent oxidoreductase